MRGVYCSNCHVWLERLPPTESYYKTVNCKCGCVSALEMGQNSKVWALNAKFDDEVYPIIVEGGMMPADAQAPRPEATNPYGFDDDIFVWLSGSDEPVYGPQTGGYCCDASGMPNDKGRYWALLHETGKDFVVVPWRKMRPRALEDLKTIEWTPDGYPMGKLHLKRARRNLNKAIARLELSYTDSIKLIKFSQFTRTACWFYNVKTGAEGIFLNPVIVQKSPLYAEFLIKHEILHRALYRGMRGCKDSDLTNITLDICIHRILCQNRTGTRNKRFMTFCRWIYPEMSRRNIVALANPTLVPSELRGLHKDIVKLWIEIWGGFANWEGEFREKTLPSMKALKPMSIYYRLLRIKDEGKAGESLVTVSDVDHGGDDCEDPDDTEVGYDAGGEDYDNPFDSTRDHGAESKWMRNVANQEAQTSQGERMENAVRNNILWGGLPLHMRRRINEYSPLQELAAWYNENVPSLDEIRARELELFTKRMRTVRLINAVKSRLESELRTTSSMDPYPECLTEDGIMMVACGLVPTWYPLFANEAPTFARKKVALYMDLSPSMAPILGHLPSILDAIDKRCDIEWFTSHSENSRGGYVFAGSVQEVGASYIEDMRKGHVKIVGDSTCFDEVISHAVAKVESSRVDIVLLVTDGLSGIHADNVARFNRTGKKCFSLVMALENERNTPESIEHLLQYSGLRALNGECLFLDLPPYMDFQD